MEALYQQGAFLLFLIKNLTVIRVTMTKKILVFEEIYSDLLSEMW